LRLFLYQENKKMNQELITFLALGLLGCVALFYGANSIFKSKNQNESKKNTDNISLPLIIQAHERITLFLERIKPENLLTRILPDCVSGKDVQQRALQEIKTELNHNVAQQIYIKPGTWEKIELCAQILTSDIISSNQEADAKTFVINILSNENLASKNIIKDTLLQLKADIQERF
jgi:hypothetical protein